jgi:hypothetical protein
MTDREVLTLIETKAKPVIAGDNEPPVDDNPVYGFDRTRKPKMMLEFISADASSVCIPYPQILRMSQSAGCFLSVYTSSGVITVEGVNLKSIASRIKRGDLSYIREGKTTAPDGVRVDSIRFEVGKDV